MIEQMNERGRLGQPFVFLIDFDFEKPLIFNIEDASELLWQIPGRTNCELKGQPVKTVIWQSHPPGFEKYQQAFTHVQHHIHNGDTYLLNLTMPTALSTNLSASEIFSLSKAPYKIWYKGQFVCFSPEVFVRIDNGKISSFPIKGTIVVNVGNAEQILLTDQKEVEENHTIVDLIRNDLSIVASEVEVEQFMYIDRISTNKGDLLQMSSRITGKLPVNYCESIGTILSELLPAGSICGAPKAKTIEIIKKAESYERGYYTGVFGVFDGNNLDSCVLIRYIEEEGETLTFKSGGGITHLSDCLTEYNELIRKVYVPIS